MKTGKIADMLGVDQKTILNWTDRPEFLEFFSSEARGVGRSMGRDYTEVETVILNTIRTERQKNTDWSDIARLLRDGVRDSELPPSALLVDSPAPLVQYGKMQQLQAQVDLLEKENSQLREELRQVREDNRHLQQQQNSEMERLLKQKETEAVQREGELREQIGELKAELRLLRKEQSDDK
jgi:DNA-binding transcriptional MerR regulator